MADRFGRIPERDWGLPDGGGGRGPESDLPGSTPSEWDDWQNAVAYQAYLEDFSIYDWLNRDLAAIADLGAVRRVLDVACGTGATALACLPHLNRDAELVGLDAAAPMIELARAEVTDPRCRFLVGDVRRMSRHLDGQFDRAVCNAAFWQLPDTQRVLAELARVLAPDARLTFNIPTQQLEPDESLAHPFQNALALALATRRASPPSTVSQFASQKELEAVLASGGFSLEVVEEVAYEVRQSELVRLMRLPAMTASLAPDLPVRVCQEAISMAADCIDPTREVELRWTFVRARFSPAGRPGPDAR